MLTYHRIGPHSEDPALTLNPALGVELFERELEHLLRRYRIVVPTKVPAAARERRPGEPFPVGLAFDDDTRSHVDVVAPILRTHGVRAGFFLGGWTLAGRPRPWWETLQLAVDERLVDPKWLSAPPALVEAALRRERHAIRRLGREIEVLEPDRRRELTLELDGLTSGLRRDAGLDAATIRALADVHEVGFHTRRHDTLTALSDDGLAEALATGNAELAQAAGRPITSIAYPHGQADERVAAAAAGAGYTTGFRGSNRALSPRDDALLLPRLAPSHESIGVFAITVARAFGRHE